jgi:hypothetical protein
MSGLLFAGGIILVGLAAGFAILMERAPFGFQCERHGYIEGKFNRCPRCAAEQQINLRGGAHGQV